jgi:hypothetical protein
VGAWRRGHCGVESVPGSDEYHLLRAASHRGVDQSAVQQSTLEDGHDHATELAALRFVDGDGVRDLDSMEIFLSKLVENAIQATHQRLPPIRLGDSLDVAWPNEPFHNSFW